MRITTDIMCKGIISGMVLGDGHLHKYQRRLELLHTIPQAKYLRFKIRLAKELGYNTRIFKLTKKRTNLGIFDYTTGTINMGDIENYYTYSLEQLLLNLNPLGLLIWWLDDGHLSITKKQSGSISRFGYLNTQSFTLSENKIIGEYLFSKFNIETRIHKDTKSGLAKDDYFRIYINATNFRKLIDIVRVFINYIPEEMLYKLDMGYVLNNNPDSEYLKKHYNF